MRVFDCFPYWREYDHVAARRDLWASHPEIDVTMVAMIASHTHSGVPIVLNDRIRSGNEPNVVTFDIDVGDPNLDGWAREFRQRNALSGPIDRLANSNDLILQCDADEIVNPAMVSIIAEQCAANGPVALGMTLLYYNLDWASPITWTHPKAFLRHQMPPNLSTLRNDLSIPVVPGTGWHISWQGGEESRSSKARSFSHSEFATDEAIEGLEKAALEGKDPHGNPLTPFDRLTLPPAILGHMS